MQKNIFETQAILPLVAARHVKLQETRSSPKTTEHHVSATMIYNEDDLFRHPHQAPTSLHEHHLDLHGHDATLAHAHYLSQIASVFDDYYIDETPDFTDDSTASSDDEFDEILTPNEEVQAQTTAFLRPEEDSSTQQKDHETIPETKHVAEIQGQYMSWWPLPTAQQQFDLDYGEAYTVDSIRTEHRGVVPRTRNTVPEDHHVSTIQGQLMTWWPLRTKDLEYEWSERFYE